jgi:hypothetical protein
MARDLSRKLARAQLRLEKAQEDRNAAIREAAEAGMTRRAIAAATGLSHQRVQQIVTSR